MDLSLSDIVARRSVLAPPDVVALMLALAAELTDEAMAAARRPSREHVLVSSAGEIVVIACDSAIAPGGEARWLAELTYDLLGLESVGADREPVPGGLLLLLARALGQIDLPPPTYPEFLDRLARAGSADRPSLAAIHARCAAAAPAGLAPVPQLEGEWPLGPPIPEPDDRRRVEASVTELRREIRENERRLFEALGAPPPARQFRRGQRVAVAAGVAAIAISALALAAVWGPGAPPRAASEALRPPSEVPPAGRGASTAAHRSPATERLRDDAATVDGIGAAAAARSSGGSTDSGSAVAIASAPPSPTASDRVASSPDGRWIAYASDRAGPSAMYVARQDGTGARKISGPGRASTPMWSPDGRRLAFLEAEPTGSGVSNLWLSDLRTGALTRLTSLALGRLRGAAWFPGGDRIAYGVDDTLVIADVSGGRSHRVKSPVAGGLVRMPAVSPDSTRIAFQVLRDGVWTYDLVSGELRRILADSSAEPFSWSPDGQLRLQRRTSDAETSRTVPDLRDVRVR
jgi:hypothetical protein